MKITPLVMAVVVLCGCATNSSNVRPFSKIVCPVVSPSGRKVAFITIRELPQAENGMPTLKCELLVLNLEDGTLLDTRLESDIGIYPLTWSPDESKIVFPSGKLERYEALQQLDLTRGSVRIIAHPECEAPQFSPDGKMLGFLSLHRWPDAHFRGWGGGLKYDLVLQSPSKTRRVLVEDINWSWCWAKDGGGLFYIHGPAILYHDLKSNQATVLVSLDETNATHKELRNLVLSPDGSELGYTIKPAAKLACGKGSDVASPMPLSSFHLVDLHSKQSEKLFEYDHYFGGFQWNCTGILYQDQYGNERRKQGRLLLYDVNNRSSRTIITGSIDSFQWIDNSHVLYRQRSGELWIVDATTGHERKVFPVQSSPTPVASR